MRLCIYINICAAWYDVKTHAEVFNTKTFGKLNNAIGVVGLHGLDTLFGYMIKNQLQHVQSIFKNSADKLVIGNIEIKNLDQIITKGHKAYQQLTDVLVVIGTLQLLRKHIAFQLNTCCKFDSAHLEASLRTMNEALLNEIRQARKTESESLPLELMHNIEEYLVRCGISEPFEKVYVKHALELVNTDMGRIMATVLISQLTKLQICTNTGDLITKKPGENIDGYPFFVGIYTVLRQTKTVNFEIFIEFLCNYAKFVTVTKLKAAEPINEGLLIVRVLQLFCETFSYPFGKLENKLPLVLLSQAPQK